MWALCRGGIDRESKLKEGKVGGGWFLPILLVLVVVDQITKFLVEGRMRETRSRYEDLIYLWGSLQMGGVAL